MDALDIHGNSVIAYACSINFFAAVELLLKKGAKSNKLEGAQSEPLIVAAYYSSPKIVNLLLEYGATLDNINAKFFKNLISNIFQSKNTDIFKRRNKTFFQLMSEKALLIDIQHDYLGESPEDANFCDLHIDLLKIAQGNLINSSNNIFNFLAVNNRVDQVSALPKELRTIIMNITILLMRKEYAKKERYSERRFVADLTKVKPVLLFSYSSNVENNSHDLMELELDSELKAEKKNHIIPK